MAQPIAKKEVVVGPIPEDLLRRLYDSVNGRPLSAWYLPLSDEEVAFLATIGITPDEDARFMAAVANTKNFDVKFFETKCLFAPYAKLKEAAGHAAVHGNLDFLKFLHTQPSLKRSAFKLVDTGTIARAILHGHRSIAEWWLGKHKDNTVVEMCAFAKYAVDQLRWIQYRVKALDMIDYCAVNAPAGTCVFDVNCMNVVLEQGDCEICALLVKFGCPLPTPQEEPTSMPAHARIWLANKRLAIVGVRIAVDAEKMDATPDVEAAPTV